jgi:2-aminoadipate transaminase
MLRELIAERLRSRGISAEADHVVVTTGSQQALDIVARSLTRKVIAIEDPVYQHARSLFRSLGNQLVPLRLDPFGPIDEAAWQERLIGSRPGLFYSITSFHNPTGRSYSTTELAFILELAAELGFGLLEDDWGSDMLSCNEYRPTLRALGGDAVLYVNSFTKKLLPSLRLGFVVADEGNVPSLVAAKRLSTLGNATLIEATLAEFLDRGYYDTHLCAVQAALDERYHACLQALRELMPEGVRWTTPGGGPTLWLELPRSVDLRSLRERLRSRKITIEPMSAAFDAEPHLHGFPVGYAALTPETMRRSLEALAMELAR